MKRAYKLVTKRGMRRSLYLGANDPRHRREPQQRLDPRPDAEIDELKKRLKALEDQANDGNR